MLLQEALHRVDAPGQGVWPNLPVWSSRIAAASSSHVFIAKGPCATTGAPIGYAWPDIAIASVRA